MVYYIFTDGAFKSGEPAIGMAYIALTDKKFLRMRQYKSNGRSPVRAEIIAVGLAIRYLLKEVDLKEKDIVELNTDSKATIEYITTGKCEYVVEDTCDKRLTGSLHWYKLLCEKVTVRFNKSWAHTDVKLNENKLADRLAKYALFQV